MAKRKSPNTTDRINFKSAGAVRTKKNGHTKIDALTLVGMKREGFAQEYAELKRQERVDSRKLLPEVELEVRHG